MAEIHHLQKRGSTWHFLRRVPGHLVSAIGKSVVRKSLATPDLKIAKARRNALEVAVDAQFQAAEASIAAPDRPMSQPTTLATLTEHLRVHIASTDEPSAARVLADHPEVDLPWEKWRSPTEELGGVLWETETDRRRSFDVKRYGWH